MKNIIKWLDKNNIEYDLVTIGEKYFNNAAPLHFQAIQITVWYDKYNNYNLQNANKEKALKYCTRYGYKVFNSWFTGNYDTVIITTAAAYNAIKLYQEYSAPAAAECELLMHRYYTEPLTINLNNELKKIMFKYGALYNAALNQAATA